MNGTLVENADDARAFVEVPRTTKGRILLRVGRERLEVNRWGTVLVSGLVAGSPMLHQAVKALRPRRIKRPDPASATGDFTGALTPVSTATIAAPLGQEAPPTSLPPEKPNRAMRRAARRVHRYASGDIRVATDDEAARRFLIHALATPDPVVAAYLDHEVVFTPDGSRAVLALFTTSYLRLTLVHLLLGADAFRPRGENGVKSADVSDPADPWGPFPGDAPTLGILSTR